MKATKHRSLFLSFFILLYAATALGNIDVDAINREIRANGFKWTAHQNRFTSLPPAERKKLLGYQISDPKGYNINTDGQIADVHQDHRVYTPSLKTQPPSKLDWRNYNGHSWMTNVKDQGNCGSCWDFAVLGAWEARIKIFHNLSSFIVDKSEQYVLSCSGGSCNGWGFGETADFIYQNGCPDEECMPYDYVRYDRVPCSDVCFNWRESADSLANGTFLTSNAPNSLEKTVIKQNLADGPLVAAMKVYTDFFSYGTGIYQHTYGREEGWHGIVLAGYDDTTNPPCWIAKNSWGDDWGENGYFRISQNDVDCAFATDCYECIHYELMPNQTLLSYDDVLGSVNFGTGQYESLFAGVEFSLAEAGILTAVETRFARPNMRYEIFIYDDISNTGDLGKLLTHQSGEFGVTCGIKRIDLENPVHLPAGHVFIAIKYGAVPYPIPLESVDQVFNSGNSWYGGTTGASPWQKLVKNGDVRIRGIFETTGTCALGDVNNDQLITPGDALCAFQIYLYGKGKDAECVNECAAIAADATCDGIISPLDALTIFLAYLNGEAPPLPCPESGIRTEPVAAIQLDSSTMRHGHSGQLELPIQISSTKHINALGFEIEFDPAAYQYRCFKKGDLVQAWDNFSVHQARPGLLRVGGFDPHGFASTSFEELMTVTFTRLSQTSSETDMWSISNPVDHLIICGRPFADEKTVTVAENQRLLIPQDIQLQQNFPNPFNSQTVIVFHLSAASFVRLDIIDLHGRVVKTLVNGHSAPGRHAVVWDGSTNSGEQRTSGVYVYKLAAANFNKTKKLLLIK